MTETQEHIQSAGQAGLLSVTRYACPGRIMLRPYIKYILDPSNYSISATTDHCPLSPVYCMLNTHTAFMP